MEKISAQNVCGGKGTMGKSMERSPNICAAGKPTVQQDQSVAGCLNFYRLQDEIDALTNDAIKPEIKYFPTTSLRRKPLPDMRNAGPFGEGTMLINPPVKTKFQELVEDCKSTTYSSYWKKAVGSRPDPAPYLPKGFDLSTTLGKKNTDHDDLYDVVMPNKAASEIPKEKKPAYQTDRNYCRPAFDPEAIFGKRVNVDPSGKWMKCCMVEDKVLMSRPNIILNARKADFMYEKQVRFGKVMEPCDNISSVPPGHSFGLLTPPDNATVSLTSCPINPVRDDYKKSLAHLNLLRKCLKKRFDKPFFSNLYLKLKYFDKSKTGWLPKELVYKYCNTKFIRFNSFLLEPLMATFNSFDGSQIEYRSFIDMLNPAIPTIDLPKVWDIPEDCIEFRTTYGEMTKLGQEPGKAFMAGVPSGRYFDKDYPVTPERCCKADRAYLPQESDAKCCLSPSVFTLLGITHRDMYAKRTNTEVRRVFEAAGEKFTDEKFETIWNNAKKYHSDGWVSFETFRKALDEAER